MIFSEQFFARIATDHTEFFVHIGDRACAIGHRDNRMLVHRELLIFNLLQGRAQLQFHVLSCSNIGVADHHPAKQTGHR